MLADARALVFAALAAALAPDPLMTVSAWAEQERVVAPESSPYPGRWRNELVPYLAELMDCLSPSNPCREVTLKKSAQVAGTEAGINLFGFIASKAPAPMLIVLPTVDEAKKYVRVKLQPAIEATPSLKAAVFEQKSRDERGSTTTFKKFAGGYAVITGANSSAGLQMISVKVIIKEELSEWPFDVDGRGDPDELADTRATAFSESCKKFNNSTPGLKGLCRISKKYDASDRRRYHVPCPHCGAEQILKWQNLKWASDSRPHGAYFTCSVNGCIIEPGHKPAMMARGRWIAELPGEGREPGFHIWQAYSPFVSWDDTVAGWLKAKGNPLKEKVFTQQVLGEDYEETGEAPAWEKLLAERQVYKLGAIPHGGLFLTATVDVQGNRLEFATYAWGAGLTSWLIDKGIIEGDPEEEAVWHAIEERLIQRKYEDGQGRLWRADAIGIDSGHLSNRVCAFCRRHALDPETRTTRVFALKGVEGWGKPPIGTAFKVDVDFAGKRIGTTMGYPVGTWDMKSALYGALVKTIKGRDETTGRFRLGAAIYPDACDGEFFKQLTAEYLAPEIDRNGRQKQVWKKTGANEQLDLAVYARALAHHLSDQLTPEGWADLAARRAAEPDQVQRDLAALWSPGLAPAETPNETPPATPAKPEPAPENWIGERAERWWN